MPVVLAQLLIQFQPPNTIQLQNNTYSQLDQLNRTARSINNAYHSIDDHRNKLNIEYFNKATIYAYNHTQSKRDLSNNQDVSKVPIKHEATAKSDREDEFMLSDPIANSSYFTHMWNDIYWLGTGVTVMATLGFMFVQHSDLRQRMVGARMRIACCSLIYRKVIIYLNLFCFYYCVIYLFFFRPCVFRKNLLVILQLDTWSIYYQMMLVD